MESVIDNLTQRLLQVERMEGHAREDLQRARDKIVGLEAEILGLQEEREQIEEAINVLKDVDELAEAMVTEEAA